MTKKNNSKEKLISLEGVEQRTAKGNKLLFDDLRDELATKEERIDHKIEKVEGKIEDSSRKAIEILAIFVALFTFVSVEFQAFQLAKTPQIVGGLSLIMLGALTFFVVLVDIVLSLDLPIRRVEKSPGMFDSIVKAVRTIGTAEVVELKLSDPTTWGVGFKLRVLIIFLSFVLIVGGILLTILPSTSTKIESEQRLVPVATTSAAPNGESGTPNPPTGVASETPRE